MGVGMHEGGTMKTYGRPVLAAFAALASTISGCDSTHELPPLVPPGETTDVNSTTVPPTGTDPQETDDATAEPAIPAMYLLYLKNRLVIIEDQEQQTACFTNLASPCTGKVKTPTGELHSLTADDQCVLTYPDGQIHVVVRNSQGVTNFDVRIILPDGGLGMTTTEIGEGDIRAFLNKTCTI